MKVPEPLRHGDVLEMIETYHAMLSQPGARGSFRIECHYGETGEQKTTVEGFRRTFVVRKGTREATLTR